MAIKGRVIGGLAGATLLAGILITAFEGRVLSVYPDPATKGAPWTYCDGLTQNPQVGHAYTNAECDAETAALLIKVDAAVTQCLGRSSPLPDKVRASFISLSWNIGNAGFCKSTTARLAKAGDLAGACKAMAKYVYAAGKVMRGLQIRRGQEVSYCLDGVAGR